MASTAKTRIFDTVATAYGPITHGTVRSPSTTAT